MVMYGKLKRGFEYPDIKFVVLTETDIFGAEKKKRKKKKIYEGERIQSFSELKPGIMSYTKITVLEFSAVLRRSRSTRPCGII